MKIGLMFGFSFIVFVIILFFSYLWLRLLDYSEMRKANEKISNERIELFHKLELILAARRIEMFDFLAMCNRIFVEETEKKGETIESINMLSDEQLRNIIRVYGVGVPGVGKEV